jgi:isopentenyl-diphosphate delta-isomerase
MKQVILCNEDGTPTGRCEVWDAHLGGGKLHQAFSICIFRNDRTEMLIQQRNQQKLFGGYWANTCCSHPRPDSNILFDAKKRLDEELGFTVNELATGPSFVYKAADPDDKGTEYEFDTILLGDIEGDEVTISAAPDEIAEHKWISITALADEMKNTPDQFAPWFHIIFERLVSFGTING